MIPPFYSSFPSFGGSFVILFYSFTFLVSPVRTFYVFFLYPFPIPYLSSQQMATRYKKTWATKQKTYTYPEGDLYFPLERHSWGYGFGNRRIRPGSPSLEMDAYGIMDTWQYV